MELADTITDVIAAGPANKGIAKGKQERNTFYFLINISLL